MNAKTDTNGYDLLVGKFHYVLPRSVQEIESTRSACG
jgi:hypothetical protein